MNQAVTMGASRPAEARRAGPVHLGEAVAGGGEAHFAAEEAGIRLSVTVDVATQRLMIRQARHSGADAGMQRDVLEAFCATVEGRPLQEASDHGLMYVLEKVPGVPKVAGILSPRNAGAPFLLAERLIRKTHADACKHFNIEHRENHWYIRPTAEWLAKGEADQAAVLKPIFAKYLRGNGFAEGDMWITRIERGTRITVAFTDAVSYARKPKLMMSLEVHLREVTGHPLELFMDELKDANKLRRI